MIDDEEKDPNRSNAHLAGMSPKTIEARHSVRRAKAMALRVRGATYRQIGDELEMSEDGAAKLVRRELQRQRKESNENAEELRQVAHSRFEAMVRRLWTRAMPVDSEGKPLKPDYDAMRQLVNVIAQDSKIMGYAAASKHQVDLGHLQGQIGIIVEVIARVLPDEQLPKVYEAIDVAFSSMASRQLSLEGDGA